MTGTDDQPPAGDPAQQPLTLELLADLHAGVFDEQVSAALRRRVAGDERAGAVLAALDATVADLAGLPDQRVPRMPEELASRLDAALAAEAPGSGMSAAGPDALPVPVAELAARQRRRWGAAGLGMLAAGAAAVGVLAVSGVQWQIAGTPRASDAFGSATGVQPSAHPALTPATLDDALGRALSTHDYGPLSEPQTLRGCLQANGASGVTPLGAVQVTLGTTPGVLFALPTDRATSVRLLVVGPDCGPHHPATIADHVTHR